MSFRIPTTAEIATTGLHIGLLVLAVSFICQRIYESGRKGKNTKSASKLNQYKSFALISFVCSLVLSFVNLFIAPHIELGVIQPSGVTAMIIGDLSRDPFGFFLVLLFYSIPAFILSSLLYFLNQRFLTRFTGNRKNIIYAFIIVLGALFSPKLYMKEAECFDKTVVSCSCAGKSVGTYCYGIPYSCSKLHWKDASPGVSPKNTMSTISVDPCSL